MFAAAIKAERLRLLAQIERDRLLLEAVDKIDALYRHFDDIAPAAEDDRTEFERVTNPESDAPAPLPASVVQAAELTDTVQRSAPAKQSAEEPLSNGSGEVQDECAIHLPNNSNNAPAEDARLEDGLSPSKEGDTTSAATDGLAGTSVSSTDPDGGGSNSPETANQSAGSAVAAVTGANAQLADAVGVEPLPADTNPLSLSNRDVSTGEEASSGAGPQAEALQSQGTGAETLAVRDGHAQGQAASADLPTNSAAAAETGKPAGETDGSPAAPASIKDRIIACNRAHPDWDAHRIAEALGIKANSVSAYKSMLGLPIPRRAHNSPKFVPATEAPRAQAPAPAPKLIDGLSQARSVLVRQVAEKPASPEPGPASEPQPQPFTVGDQDEEPVHPTVAKFGSPNAKWFRLRRSDGMWLHMSGHGFTVEKKDGWIGKIGQLRAIRGNSRYPDARGLQIIGVTQVAK